MSEIDLLSLFLLGLFGTGHCVGMCGPLVIALPGRSGTGRAHLLYHLGRVAAYAAAGALMGAMGRAIEWAALAGGGSPPLWSSRVQTGLALAAALFLGFFSLVRLGLVREPYGADAGMPGGLRRILPLRSGAGMLAAGFLLGFLPCGLSFAAFARALAAEGPAAGAAMTLVFGLGTVPGLALLGAGAAGAARRYRKHSEILSGLLMIWMALRLGADAIQGLFG